MATKYDQSSGARPFHSQEGREGVKWELGFAFFRGWEMGFCALGLWLGFMKQKQQKMGMGFKFEQHRLGL